MRPITAFLILILSIFNASAADFDKGLKAYLAGDYATALPEFQQFAEQGDVDAQYILAGMYKAGEGVPQDSEQAQIWCLCARASACCVGALVHAAILPCMRPSSGACVL